MSYILSHTKFFCTWYWDLLAFLVLAGVVVYFIYKQNERKKEKKELEEALSALNADDVVKMDTRKQQHECEKACRLH